MNIDAFPQLVRDTKRLSEILATLARYQLAPWISNINAAWVQGHFQSLDGEPISELNPGVRMREAFTELGTTFIKLGQILSTRPDLVGPEITTELAKLQADTPADPPAIVEEVFIAELGVAPEDLFLEFDRQAAASASIGQVHFARLKDGTAVAVKIQHPGIEGKIRSDLEILKKLAELAEHHSEQARQFRPVATVEEFSRTLLAELDFSREQRNLRKFAENFADDPMTVIPRVYDEFSTPRILTMERLDGVCLADTTRLVEQGHDLDDLANRGANIFLEMIFRDEFYHADPHPGNIMVLGDSQIGLLDFGMVGRIDDQLRQTMEDMLIALNERNSRDMCNQICELGDVPSELNDASFRRDIEDFLTDYATQSMAELNLGDALNRMMEIIRSYKIVLPSRVTLLLKVLVMLEGTARALNPRFSLVEILSPYQDRIVQRRLSPGELFKRAKHNAKDWGQLVEMAPREIAELFKQIKRGKFDVHLEHRKLDPVVNRLVLGVLTAALFVGSAMILSSNVPPTFHGVSIAGSVGCLIAFAMGFRLVRAIQRSGNIESKRSDS